MSGEYETFLRHVRENGVYKGDRTGTGTYSVFGYQMRFDLQEGFPLITTKKLFTKGIVGELIWMLRGDTNVRWLQERGIHIWDEWADENGELGPVYGKQWREWVGPKTTTGTVVVDQIANVIEQIKTNPDSRRLIVTAWNPGEVDEMKLPPCHMLFQFYVSEGKLSCQLYQRSADIFLGVPFNIASYALLTHMVAAECGLDVDEFIWTGGDCHIYANHLEQVDEQLSREVRPYPKLWMTWDIDHNKPLKLEEYSIDDFVFKDYNPHPAIKAPVAV